MIGATLRSSIESEIKDYKKSKLATILSDTGAYAIKFIRCNWAGSYASRSRLKISNTPALTWGTATYITPLKFPLSSALYGRAGIVTDFNPIGWRVFDATNPTSRLTYVKWVQSQPGFSDLVLTVHSTDANHFLRNKFRRDFKIDCVIFHPDQEAEMHTDASQHVWMAVTDWDPDGSIHTDFSSRLKNGKFTVLIDEEFSIEQSGLPIRRASRQIEQITEKIAATECIPVTRARIDPSLPQTVVNLYKNDGYLHVFIAP